MNKTIPQIGAAIVTASVFYPTFIFERRSNSFLIFNLPFEGGENLFLKILCDTECYVKIASIASGQFQSELSIF